MRRIAVGVVASQVPRLLDVARGTHHQVIKMLLFAGITSVAVIILGRADRLSLNPAGLASAGWEGIMVCIGYSLFIVSAWAMLWRLVLFLGYKPFPACSDEWLPRCSVVVPAYNEGKQVLMTLRSVAASDYPPERLEIIAVDDGSEDDTWRWISEAHRELKDMLIPIRLPANQGKRHALAAGFHESRGDILVTVDSDSVLEPETLRRLVSPFVYEKRLGAMAGNVRVLNRQEGLIPRMLDVIFVFSFDFIRAGQSMVNTVMCTPGALSAYRRDLVIGLLPEWTAQTFMGRPSNIGEDRAMTNMILRRGYHVHFQQDAVVRTMVPVRYRGLCRMFLRWARSNVRETLVMSAFAFRRFREDSMIGARINLALSWLGMGLGPFLLPFTLVYLAMHPAACLINILTGVLIGSSIPAAFYCWRERSDEGIWSYLYGAFWFFGLSWITPYSILTAHKSGWLTRQIPRSQVPKTDPLVAIG